MEHLMPELFTRADLCRVLRVSDRTLSRYMVRGRIPPPAFGEGKSARWTPEQFPGIIYPPSCWKSTPIRK